MTVLGCTVKPAPTRATGWRRASVWSASIEGTSGNNSATRAPGSWGTPTCARPPYSPDSGQQTEADGELAEQEHQPDQRQCGDEERAREQGAEQLVVVLQVHVERDDRGELHCREDQQHRHEERRVDQARDVVRPHLD